MVVGQEVKKYSRIPMAIREGWGLMPFFFKKQGIGQTSLYLPSPIHLVESIHHYLTRMAYPQLHAHKNASQN